MRGSNISGNSMHRLTPYLILAGMVLIGGLARAQDPAVSVQGYQILGPASPADFARWIADMRQWRMEYRKRIGYDDSEYRRPNSSGPKVASCSRR